MYVYITFQPCYLCCFLYFLFSNIISISVTDLSFVLPVSLITVNTQQPLLKFISRSKLRLLRNVLMKFMNTRYASIEYLYECPHRLTVEIQLITFDFKL